MHAWGRAGAWLIDTPTDAGLCPVPAACREGYASLPEAPHLCGVAARGKFARHVHVVLLQQLCLPLLMTLPPAEDEDEAHAAATQQGPQPAAGHGSNQQCEVRRLLTRWHCPRVSHAHASPQRTPTQSPERQRVGL